MADMFDKEELGIVSSLFGVSPAMQNKAMQQAAYKRGTEAGQNLLGGVLGNVGMFSEAAGQGLRSGLGVQSPEERMMGIRQQAQQQFDINTPEGLLQMADYLNSQGDAAGARQAVMLAQGQQARTQGIATSRAQQLRAEREPGQVNFQQLLSSGKYTPASIAKFRDSQNPADLVLVKEVGGADGVGKLSPAQRAADTAFGKEYNDFVAGGGITTIQKNLADLDKAIEALEKSPQGDITGKLIGLSDKAGTLSFTNPKAAEIKDIVGGVVQSNLRAVLGGQFAQKEGEALLARAYNPAQPQKDNLNRLKALRQQIANTGQAKLQAVSEFEEKGTLKDFKASNVRAAQIDDTNKKKTTKTLKSGVTVEIEE
jgi:hypothetical protein